jgi:hypothetical protein
LRPPFFFILFTHPSNSDFDPLHSTAGPLVAGFLGCGEGLSSGTRKDMPETVAFWQVLRVKRLSDIEVNSSIAIVIIRLSLRACASAVYAGRSKQSPPLRFPILVTDLMSLLWRD